jgi:ribosomal protein L37AE/L43A
LPEEQQQMIKNLAKALRDLPDAYDHLRYFREGGSRSSALDSVRRTSSDPHASVSNLEVLHLTDVRTKINADLYPTGDHRLGVLPALSRWVRFVDEELIKACKDYDPPYRFVACCGSCVYLASADVILPWAACCTGRRMSHWEPKTVATECAFLFDHMNFIGDQAWLHKIEAEITGMLSDVLKIIGKEVRHEYVCLNCGDLVTPRYNGQAFICHGCGRAWGWPELRNMAERAKPITIKEAAEKSGASVRLLKSYVTKGKITPLDEKRGRAKLYDLAEVMSATVELRYHKRALQAS